MIRDHALLPWPLIVIPAYFQRDIAAHFLSNDMHARDTYLPTSQTNLTCSDPALLKSNVNAIYSIWY